MREKRVKHIFKPEWLTGDILKAMAKRNAHKKEKNFVNYKLWRNRVLKLIRKAKSTFYIHEIVRNKSDPRKLWKLVNELAPKMTHTTQIEVAMD